MSTDKSIHDHINDLVNEEHQLRDGMQSGTVSREEGNARLKEIEAMLDQSWDLLRQRQGKRDAGENPNAAEERSTSVVENYLD